MTELECDMQLNSGLLMRKLGESAYAAARRFAIANRAHNYPALIKLARKRVPREIFDSQKYRSIISQLAHYVETEHCRSLGIEGPSYATDPPAPFSDQPWWLTISRNCPVCAAAVFHSPLYELPWLIRCPIHRRQLMTRNCPSCGKAWPAISEWWARSCHLCGIDIGRDALIQACGVHSTWDVSSLQLLARCVDQRLRWDGTLIKATDVPIDDKSEICQHTPLSPRNDFFPSVIASFDVEFRNWCRKQKIHVERCLYQRFLCTPLDCDGERADASEQDLTWVLACQRNIRRKITAAIAHSAGSTHHLIRRNSHFIWGAQTYHCAYCMAFSFWCDLIEAEPQCSAMNLSWLLTLRALPAAPRPMRIMTSKSIRRAANLSRPSTLTETHLLPNAARSFLYSLDLWTTFVTLFHHVEYSLKIYEENPSLELRHVYLSEAAKYREFISHSIAFWKNSADELVVCVPRSVIQPTLRTSFSTYWLKACTQNQR